MKKILFSLITSVSLFAKTQAVIFDFGGVMASNGNRQLVIDFLCASLHIPRDTMEQANLEKRRQMAINNGVSDVTFWQEYAKEHGIALPETWSASFLAVLKQSVEMKPNMYALVDELKEKKLTVGMLSNVTEMRIVNYLRSFGCYDPFDPCLLSLEINADKPDPRAYQILLERLKLSPEKVVFIDDKSENVDAARALGIDAILFKSYEELRLELKKRELL